MRFWRRTPDPAVHPAVWTFLDRVTKLDESAWASVLETAARRWAKGGPDDGSIQASIFAGMAVDPDIDPYKAILLRPDPGLQRVIDAGGRARQVSDGLAGFMLVHSLMMTGKPVDANVGIGLSWIVDTLVKTAAVAIARQERLPRRAVLAGIGPFVEAMPSLGELVNAAPPTAS